MGDALVARCAPPSRACAEVVDDTVFSKGASREEDLDPKSAPACPRQQTLQRVKGGRSQAARGWWQSSPGSSSQARRRPLPLRCLESGEAELQIEEDGGGVFGEGRKVTRSLEDAEVVLRQQPRPVPWRGLPEASRAGPWRRRRSRHDGRRLLSVLRVFRGLTFPLVHVS